MLHLHSNQKQEHQDTQSNPQEIGNHFGWNKTNVGDLVGFCRKQWDRCLGAPDSAAPSNQHDIRSSQYLWSGSEWVLIGKQDLYRDMTACTRLARYN